MTTPVKVAKNPCGKAVVWSTCDRPKGHRGGCQNRALVALVAAANSR